MFDEQPTSVFVAGATGYLGSHIVQECVSRGWETFALARSEEKGEALAKLGATPVVAQATRAESLAQVDAMAGVDVVISALGITRQSDGVGYMDVDYGANLNLLEHAMRQGVRRFCYVSVLCGAQLADRSSLIFAKESFVRALEKAPLEACVIRPSAFFSDMGDLFEMARSGRAWVLGDGTQQMNPISGRDLAVVCADTMVGDVRDEVAVGGPEVLSMRAISSLAFDVLGKDPKITGLPMWLARGVGKVLPYITPREVHGPIEMFLAMGDCSMVAPCYGSDTLREHFASLVPMHTLEKAG